MQQSLEFTPNGAKKYPVNGSSVDRNALLMREVNREWPDWFELTKSMVTQIAALYKCGEKNSISECYSEMRVGTV